MIIATGSLDASKATAYPVLVCKRSGKCQGRLPWWSCIFVINSRRVCNSLRVFDSVRESSSLQCVLHHCHTPSLRSLSAINPIFHYLLHFFSFSFPFHLSSPFSHHFPSSFLVLLSPPFHHLLSFYFPFSPLILSSISSISVFDSLLHWSQRHTPLPPHSTQLRFSNTLRPSNVSIQTWSPKTQSFERFYLYI